MDLDRAPDRLRTLPSFLLNQAALEARRVVAETFAGEGLYRSQFALLAALAEFGPQSQAELSSRGGLDRSDVVRLVDDLVEQGLVRRTQDPADRRRNVISLNQSGRRRLRTLERKVDAAQEKLLRSLTPAERTQLVELLGRLLGL